MSFSIEKNVHKLCITKILVLVIIGGIFKTVKYLWSILQKQLRLQAVNNFGRMLLFRCFTEFWKRLWCFRNEKLSKASEIFLNLTNQTQSKFWLSCICQTIFSNAKFMVYLSNNLSTSREMHNTEINMISDYFAKFRRLCYTIALKILFFRNYVTRNIG